MKIVIVGPGAMGSLFGAFLARSKNEVWLLDRNKERAARINEQGVTVEGVSGNWRQKVPVITDISEVNAPDLVVMCVKSYDTKEATRIIKPLVGNATYVLTLQNGVGNVEIIGEIIGEEKVIGGVTNEGATLIDIGHITHAGRGETVIGLADGKIPVFMRDIREAFNRCGFETRISRDIKGLLWSKLIINVGINALTAITRMNNGRLTEFEGTRKILREAVTEAVKIAKRKRVKLIYDDPLAKVEAVCEATSGNVSSMLQDVLRKKRTEIDFINGVIVRLAQELGLAAPVNSLLVDLVKTLEASYPLRVQ